MFDGYHHIWENLGNVLVNASLCVPIEHKFRGVISGKWDEKGCNVSRFNFRMHECLWSHRRAIFDVWSVALSCWNQKTLRSGRYLALRCVQKRSNLSFDHYLAIVTVDPSAARPGRSDIMPLILNAHHAMTLCGCREGSPLQRRDVQSPRFDSSG